VRREEESTSSERRNLTFSRNTRQRNKASNFVTNSNKTAPELQMLKTKESQPRTDKKNLCFSSVSWDGNKWERSDQLRGVATEQR
jgi:hypothetical protein